MTIITPDAEIKRLQAEIDRLRAQLAARQSVQYQPLVWRDSRDIAQNTFWFSEKPLCEIYPAVHNNAVCWKVGVSGPDVAKLLESVYNAAYPTPDAAKAACEALHREAWEAKHGQAAPKFERDELGRVAYEVFHCEPGNTDYAALPPPTKQGHRMIGQAVAAYVLSRLPQPPAKEQAHV